MSKTILNKIDIKSTLSLGLDVSKLKIDICFNTINKDYYIKVKNTKIGIQEFIKNLKEKGLDKNIPLIIESTGDYNTLACILLSEAKYNIKEINPIITKNYVRHTIRGTKTDKTDAKVLATIGINERNLFTFTKTKNFIKINKKISLISSLEKQIQALKMTIKSFNEVNLELELDNSNASKDIEMTINELSLNIKSLQKEVEIESIGEKGDEKVDLIASITGISKYIGKVLYSTFAYKTFLNKKSMLAFTGCDPKLRDSGQFIGKATISKRGNPYVRKKLFQAAWVSTMHCEYFKKIYNRGKEKGKHHFTCVLSVAKKMIHIIYSMLKNNTIFNPNFCN